MHSNSASGIDNIFINKGKNKNYTICPFINELSDHDGQIITLHNITPQNQISYTQTIR